MIMFVVQPGTWIMAKSVKDYQSAGHIYFTFRTDVRALLSLILYLPQLKA